MSQDLEIVESIHDELNDIIRSAMNEIKQLKNREIKQEILNDLREMLSINRNLVDVIESFNDDKNDDYDEEDDYSD